MSNKEFKIRIHVALALIAIALSLLAYLLGGA